MQLVEQNDNDEKERSFLKAFKYAKNSSLPNLCRLVMRNYLNRNYAFITIPRTIM